MNTFRLVACFQHEIPTGLNFTTFASRLSCLIFIFLVSCILSDFFERSCYSGKKGRENRKFITKGTRTTWSDQGGSLINGGFQIRADLPCKHLFCPDFIKNQYFFQFFFPHPSVGGIVVSIAAFQAIDPGSIPARRKSNFSSLFE